MLRRLRCQVTGILEWVQCFTIYIAVVAGKDPGKVKDLLVLLIWDMTATSASQYRQLPWIPHKECH